jgi:cytosine/adenosine deaminase-related metal-dependent hydrolase
VLLYRELLDARTPERTQRELARVAAPAPERLRVGFAPHAPHTVSSELLRAVARAAKARGIPVAIHWAETEEEGDWLESGAGPFAALLGVSPQRSGLELLDEAGLLGPSLALVHGNRARPAEIARVARSGATLIHCPGTHAFFGREPFDLEAWRAAGVAVALGSDSMASNSALDMRLELSRLRASHPALDSRAAWDAATVHGARALGMAGLVGQLEAGAHADLLVVPAPEADGERCFERLSHGDFELRHLWLAGRAVSDSDRGLPARKSAAGCAPGECNPG